MIKNLIVRLLLITFFFTSIGPLPDVFAQTIINLPTPGILVNISIPYQPLQLKGILVDIKNPLRFDFLVDKGDSGLYGQPLKDEITSIAKYFLTCLTVPENDLWVNLSPYEKDRIIPGNFGITLMGKNLLEQDYLLKQIMASLSYPENELGKQFWEKVYRKTYELYGTTDIPINTFNKVWIVPKYAEVYAQGNGAFVVNSQLDVMLEADYKAIVHHKDNKSPQEVSQSNSQYTVAYSQIYRDVILPQLRQEINEGKNFAVVRQVYDAMILATWYKRHLKDSLLGRMYVGQNKVFGVDIADKNAKEKIFQQYLRAYKKCVYNYIKEDYDPVTQQTVPRKYASGGVDLVGFGAIGGKKYQEVSSPRGMRISSDLAMATIDVTARGSNGALVSFDDMRWKVPFNHPFHQVPQEVREAASSKAEEVQTFTDSAMFIPKFLRNLVFPIVLAVGGLLMTPRMASAAEGGSVDTNISTNMTTLSVVQSLDKQITDCQKTIRDQEGILNLFGLLGDPVDTHRTLNGLKMEDDYARTLLATGKTTLDQESVATFEVARLKGEIEIISGQITAEQKKLDRDVLYSRSGGKVGAKIIQDIGWDRHVIKEYNGQKEQLIKKEQEAELLLQSIKPPEIIKSLADKTGETVSGAVGSGVPATNETNVLPSSHPSTVVLPSATQAASQPAIVVSSQSATQEGSQPATQEAATQPAIQEASQPATQEAATQPATQEGSQPATQEAATQPLIQDVSQPATQAASQSATQAASHPAIQGTPQINSFPDLNPSATTLSVNSTPSVGVPPPPPEGENSEILKFIRGEWQWIAGFGILGIGIGIGHLWGSRSNLKKRMLKSTSLTPGSKPQQIANGPTSASPVLETNIEGILPPPASPQEAQILTQDLANMRAVVNGEIAPSLPLPVEDDTKSGSQNLSWMHAGALMAGLGLGWYQYGGLTWMAVMSPLMAGGLFIVQRWIHEVFFHLGAALLYPTKIKSTFSERNLKGNLSLFQTLKPLIPFIRTQRSYVDLPFAKAEGNWWNRLRNQIIAKAGFLGSTALAITAGYFIGLTPLLVPLVFSALAVLKGSFDSGDLLGSEDTAQGKFGCGIMGFLKRVPFKGIKKKEMKSWTTWFFKSLGTSTPRGGQQAGVSTNYSGASGISEQLDDKITKQKRNWFFWQTWDEGPVFYRNMINDLHARFYRALPDKLVATYNYTKSGVLKFLGHVRFATGGDMVQDAAHPQSSPQEIREQWIFDSIQNLYRKVLRVFNITSAFNGDKDGSKLGILYRSHLFGQSLTFRQMRTFYSAAVHSYYKKKVTIRYLMKTVSDGKKYKQEVKTDYRVVKEALRKKGYVDFWGYVNPRFVKLDDEFKSWFPVYKDEVFNEIECALFGIPPGDAPILPRAEHLYLTQGNWFSSVRYAHVMVNHHSLQEALGDILFEKEGRAVGRVFSEVYDQIQPYLARRGYMPNDPDQVRSLNDVFVKDKDTAERLGLKDQYEMLEIFRIMLEKRLEAESGENTLAGNVFRSWEQKWKGQGADINQMRRLLINVAVEKFFTADTIAATKEFAERSEGTFGLFMQNPLDDSITLYQDNQDVVIGLNQKAGVIAFGSDPRALKTIGPKGEKIEEVMPLKEGEIVNLSFAPSGKIVIKSWIRTDGKWVKSTNEDLARRISPNAEYVNGVKNQYWAPPPVEYENPRKIVQEDHRNISMILAQAQEQWDDPDSWNSQSTENLARRLDAVIRKKGKARFVIIGYDNSRKVSQQFEKITGDLIERSDLSVDVIDANQFDENPLAFNIQPDDIVMVVSKSGATFSSKLALRIINKLVDQENIFCLTARKDSVLIPLMGQGTQPKDPFTQRIFIAGEFYPAETPVVSEVLLMFQMQQLAINLVRSLESRRKGNQLGFKFSPDKLEVIAQKIKERSIIMAQELTGYDLEGNEFVNADKEIKAIGTYLGNVALERWKVNRLLDIFVGGITAAPALLFNYYIGWAGIIPNVIWIRYVVPFLVTEFYRKIIGRPSNGRDANFNLFIAGPPMIASTQRNFISRIMTNRLASIGPAGIYGENPTEDFVAAHASDQTRGDINLKFSLEHKMSVGRMGVNQATYPQTAIFGTTFLKGRPEIVEAVVKVPLEKDSTPQEIKLLDDTIGTLGLMIAAKTIGVEMARVASFDGRLFDLAYTFSSAGVHTTQINPISQEAKDILNRPSPLGVKNGERRPLEYPLAASGATDLAQMAPRKGGIDMNSRLMRLKISGETQNRIGLIDNAMPVNAIQGVVPQVSGIVTVTPEMLKSMLGEGYLN